MNCPVPINNHTAYASLFSYKVSLVTPSDLDGSPIFSMPSVFVVELLPQLFLLAVLTANHNGLKLGVAKWMFIEKFEKKIVFCQIRWVLLPKEIVSGYHQGWLGSFVRSAVLLQLLF